MPIFGFHVGPKILILEILKYMRVYKGIWQYLKYLEVFGGKGKWRYLRIYWKDTSLSLHPLTSLSLPTPVPVSPPRLITCRLAWFVRSHILAINCAYSFSNLTQSVRCRAQPSRHADPFGVWESSRDDTRSVVWGRFLGEDLGAGETEGDGEGRARGESGKGRRRGRDLSDRSYVPSYTFIYFHILSYTFTYLYIPSYTFIHLHIPS